MSPHPNDRQLPIFPCALALVGAVALGARSFAAAAPPRAPTRPIVDDLRTFAYGDLPLLTATNHASCSAAVLRIGYPRQPMSRATPTARPPSRIEGLPTDSNLRIGNRHFVSDMGYAYFPYGRVDPASNEAEWVVLDRGVSTADRASISRCTATAKEQVPLGAETIEKGFAVALVPGRVYAYRRCVDGCDQPLGSEARVEELGVLTSPALWISSSDWGSNGTPGEDAFSRGFARVRPGSTATVVIGLPPSPGSTILRSPKASEDADTFDVEVVWPVGGEPAMTVFSGHVEGDATALAVQR